MEMEAVSEFVISFEKGPEIRHHAKLINKLFGVRLEFSTLDPRAAQRSGNEWVKVTGAKESREKAKEFVKAIDKPETSSIFNIPEDVLSSGSWKQDYIWTVQQQFGAVIRVRDHAHLLIQGSQIAVVQTISLLDQYMNMLRQMSCQATAFGAQSNGYYDHPARQYYQGYYQAAAVPIDKREGQSHYMPQDTLCRGAAAQVPRTNLQNLGDTFQPSIDIPVTAKGAVLPGRFENDPANIANKKIIRPMVSESQLREYASKLDYTDDEIQTAISKCLHSTVNQVIDENALLQQLIALYPCKAPSFRANTESRVAQDGSQNSQQIQSAISDAKPQVVSSEKSQVKKDGASVISELRPIVVDGSNVAMSHGNKDVFSCKGIMICVDYFKQRGHKDITVFVPHWRKEASKPDRPIEDQNILFELEKEQIVNFTPSRRVNGQRVVCYDDRYIVRLASENDGIIVSNDNFRDLTKENPEWKKVIDERLLMYTFVRDVFMPPDDPLGRHGPSLNMFLRKGSSANPRLCPYKKKCTYGNKCKYYHPEKTHNENSNKDKDTNRKLTQDQTVLTNSSSIRSYKQQMNIPSIDEQAPSLLGFQKNITAVEENGLEMIESSGQTCNFTWESCKDKPQAKTAKDFDEVQKTSSQKTSSRSNELQSRLEDILPEHKDTIKKVLAENPNETNLNNLVNLIFAY